jgi:hypothetical protein
MTKTERKKSFTCTDKTIAYNKKEIYPFQQKQQNKYIHSR